AHSSPTGGATGDGSVLAGAGRGIAAVGHAGVAVVAVDCGAAADATGADVVGGAEIAIVAGGAVGQVNAGAGRAGHAIPGARRGAAAAIRADIAAAVRAGRA